MNNISTDNRFELIEKYKQKLINNTNIESDEKEMAAIDNILFRFWQMGWLDKLEESNAGMTVAEYRECMIKAFHNADCDELIALVVLPTYEELQHLEWLLNNEYVPFLGKANKALKAQQWIPCSERLPKKSGRYYVSGGDKVWICEFLIIPNFTGGWCNDASNPVVQAWMPCYVPEPYEGDK